MFKFGPREEKMLPLTNEELNALKVIYDKKICPQKCHTSEKRIWFIPDVIIDSGSYEYTCCINCYYNKSNMILLNGKYTREQLRPILCQGVNMNCDESHTNNQDSVQINCKLFFSIYQTSLQSKFLKLEKNGVDSYNVYCSDTSGQFSFVIDKTINGGDNDDNNEDNEDNNNLVLMAKVTQQTYIPLQNKSVLFTKTYPFSNDLCVTLEKMVEIKETEDKKLLVYKPLIYNFNNTNNTFYIDYTLKEDLSVVYSIKVTFIYNNYTYMKETYSNYYKDKELSI
jgi:hypothetical protein